MLHFLLIGILLKKVRRRKCDPSGPVDNLQSYISINGNFAKKKCDIESVTFCVNGQTKPSKVLLIEILLKKVRCRKCALWGPVDRPNLHSYIIFAQKVRHRKCEPSDPVGN